MSTVTLDSAFHDSLGRSVTRRDFHGFVRQAWEIVEPSVEYVDNWHIQCACIKLRQVARGEIPRLLMNWPPGTMKSLLVSVFWPCWTWTWWPASRWLFCSYDQALSTDFSLQRRAIFDSEWYRTRYLRVKFAADQNQKTAYRNTQTGEMVATSVKGRATGKHPDFVVVDDPNNVNRVESRVERENVVSWWRGTMPTRGMTRNVRRVVIQQRTHQNDLSGHILREEAGRWDAVVLPMRYEPERAGQDDPRKQEGEPLWPELIPEEKIRELEISLGSIRASGQLAQNPVAAGGNLVKEEHFRYFREETADLDGQAEPLYVLRDGDGRERRVWKRDCGYWYQTCDTALKEGQDNDYTVVLTACLTPPPVCELVQNVFRARLPVPRQYGMLLEQRGRWPEVSVQAVEDAASGTGLIQQGRVDGHPFHPLKRGGQDKTARGMPMVTAYENGLIYHRSGAAWVGEFEQELLSFPTGEHDDQWDAAADAAVMMQRHAFGYQVERLELGVWPKRDDEEDGDGKPRSEPTLTERLGLRTPGQGRGADD